MQGMSERQYAAHVGLSRGAIQKAKAAERLVLYPDGSINAAASDARRAETTDPSKTRKPPAPKLKPVPEAAVAAMEGKDPQMPSQEVLLHQWEETIELLHTDATEGQAPGANATEDWESTLEVLSEAGLISGDGDVDTYFDDSFTPGK